MSCAPACWRLARLSRWQRFDRLRFDPAFKLACGRLPDTGGDLCSQPTISRWRIADATRDHPPDLRPGRFLVPELPKPPRSVVLDVDDTVDVVHGHQQLAQWNAHYDERCFLPIHVYDAATGAPVVVILRPGKTPSGVEVRKLLSRLIGRIRRHWPSTHITIRGDGHYGREEAMTWCENYGIDCIFGSPAMLCSTAWSKLPPTISGCAVPWTRLGSARLCRDALPAKSWDKERRVVARIRPAPATPMTCCAEASISATSSHRCKAAMPDTFMKRSMARGQAENLIKQHKAQLSSDRTSCRSPLANQMRLILHLVPIGCYSTCVLPSRVGIRCSTQVRHNSSASLEDCQPYHRAHQPHSYRARLMLPGGQDLQSCRVKLQPSGP